MNDKPFEKDKEDSDNRDNDSRMDQVHQFPIILCLEDQDVKGKLYEKFYNHGNEKNKKKVYMFEKLIDAKAMSSRGGRVGGVAGVCGIGAVGGGSSSSGRLGAGS